MYYLYAFILFLYSELVLVSFYKWGDCGLLSLINLFIVQKQANDTEDSD